MDSPVLTGAGGNAEAAVATSLRGGGGGRFFFFALGVYFPGNVLEVGKNGGKMPAGNMASGIPCG